MWKANNRKEGISNTHKKKIHEQNKPAISTVLGYISFEVKNRNNKNVSWNDGFQSIEFIEAEQRECVMEYDELKWLIRKLSSSSLSASEGFIS